VGNIFADVLVNDGLGRNVRSMVTMSADDEAYDEMARSALCKDQNKHSARTSFHSGKKARPSPNEFARFFMAIGAFGLLIWVGAKIVAYYELWLPTLEDYDYNHFQYSEAAERYVDILFAADAWGLFLVIIAILGVLTLVTSELYHQR